MIRQLERTQWLHFRGPEFKLEESQLLKLISYSVVAPIPKVYVVQAGLELLGL